MRLRVVPKGCFLLQSLLCPHAQPVSMHNPRVFVFVPFCCPLPPVAFCTQAGTGRYLRNTGGSVDNSTDEGHLVQEVGWHRTRLYLGMRVVEMVKPSRNLMSGPHLTVSHRSLNCEYSKKKEVTLP